MPRRSLDLRQRPPASQRVADKRVPPVVDRQGAEAVPAQDAACRVEPTAEDVTVERLAERGRLERTDRRVVPPGALSVAVVEPGLEVGQTSRAPGFSSLDCLRMKR